GLAQLQCRGAPQHAGEEGESGDRLGLQPGQGAGAPLVPVLDADVHAAEGHVPYDVVEGAGDAGEVVVETPGVRFAHDGRGDAAHPVDGGGVQVPEGGHGAEAAEGRDQAAAEVLRVVGAGPGVAADAAGAQGGDDQTVVPGTAQGHLGGPLGLVVAGHQAVDVRE